MDVGLTDYLIISTFMFSCGLLTILLRRNAVAILMGIELMLNAANINFLAFSFYRPRISEVAGVTRQSINMDGHIFAIFVVIIAAAEAAVGLALVIRLANQFKTIDIESADTLKG